MRRLMDDSKEYVSEMSLWQVGLLKVCVLCAGVLLGLAVPKKVRPAAMFAALALFVGTFVSLAIPILGQLMDEGYWREV